MIKQIINDSNLKLKKIKEEASPVPIKHISGKNFRSYLFLSLCYSLSKNAGIDTGRLSTLSSAIELVHESSLVVDDAFDKSDTRRGKDTTFKIYGRNTALLIGNLYLLKAGRIFTQHIDLSVMNNFIDEFFDTATGLVEGELKQQLQIGNNSCNAENIIREYLLSIEGKTSSLFILSCILAVIECNVDYKHLDYFKKLGYLIGISFQLNDDIRDMYFKEEHILKPTENDLNNGVFSFPVCYALKKSSVNRDVQEFISTFNFLSIKEEVITYSKKCYKSVFKHIDNCPINIDTELLKGAIKKILTLATT